MMWMMIAVNILFPIFFFCIWKTIQLRNEIGNRLKFTIPVIKGHFCSWNVSAAIVFVVFNKNNILIGFLVHWSNKLLFVLSLQPPSSPFSLNSSIEEENHLTIIESIKDILFCCSIFFYEYSNQINLFCKKLKNAI